MITLPTNIYFPNQIFVVSSCALFHFSCTVGIHNWQTEQKAAPEARSSWRVREEGERRDSRKAGTV